MNLRQFLVNLRLIEAKLGASCMTPATSHMALRAFARSSNRLPSSSLVVAVKAKCPHCCAMRFDFAMQLFNHYLFQNSLGSPALVRNLRLNLQFPCGRTGCGCCSCCLSLFVCLSMLLFVCLSSGWGRQVI